MNYTAVGGKRFQNTLLVVYKSFGKVWIPYNHGQPVGLEFQLMWWHTGHVQLIEMFRGGESRRAQIIVFDEGVRAEEGHRSSRSLV